MSADPTESDVPAGLEPWCKTLRGEQAWRMEIPGGEAALVRWKALRDQHSVTGMWPVLLGADMSIIDQMTWRVSILAEQAPGIPEVSAATPAPELFVQWLGDPAHDDYLGDVPRHLAKLEADQATIRARLEARPDHAAVRAAGSYRRCWPGPGVKVSTSAAPNTCRCFISGTRPMAPRWWRWASSNSSAW